MTDKPTTLSLNARQWRVLMNDHLDVLKTGVATGETLDDVGLKEVRRLLDEVRLMASAWYQNSVPTQPASAAAPQPQEQTPAPVKTNGAAPVKRKGGWPLGKKRNAPREAMQ